MKRPSEEDGQTGRKKARLSDESVLAAIATRPRQKCPYLDTIQRNLLDFDFEKVCSETLSNHNVYACLVCGKYFQGRGAHTPAYTHSVQCSHHVFINLGTKKIYCLPDNYEVVDSSLRDIQDCLDPRFEDPASIKRLDRNTTLSRDVFGVTYLPGFVGLNNLSGTDFVNVVVQALARVAPLRNHFLREISAQQKVELDGPPRNLVTLAERFGTLMRKIWSDKNFKSCVSPHELMQAISLASDKRFVIGRAADAAKFLSWFLNALHQGLGGGRKKSSSAVNRALRGTVRVKQLHRVRKIMDLQSEGRKAEHEDEDDAALAGATETKAREMAFPAQAPGVFIPPKEEESGPAIVESWEASERETPFLFLSLDIPPTPLFKDSEGGNVVAQTPLFQILRKYDGETWTDQLIRGEQYRKQYRITDLPDYLILVINRFTKNNFYIEKNPTIVTFPVKNLELKEHVQLVGKKFENHALSDAQIREMSVADLKKKLKKKSVNFDGVIERAELERLLKEAYAPVVTKYDLVANICHQAPPGQSAGDSQVDPIQSGTLCPLPMEIRGVDLKDATRTGSYRVHVLNRASGQWYEIQDLHVLEIMPQQIGLSESYIMIYERQGVEFA